MNIKQLHKASSLQDAYASLNASSSNAIIAGGGWMKFSGRTLEKAIDLSDLGLDAIEASDNEIVIGSMCSLRSIETSPLLSKHFNGILPDAAAQIVGIGLRNLVTIGGSIMGRYGFSDILGPLLCMQAELEFYHSGIIPLSEFLSEKRIKDDILIAIRLPKHNGCGYFKKVRKTALDFAVLNITVSKIDGKYYIALGSRPAVACFAHDAMAYLNSVSTIDNNQIDHAATLTSNVSFGDNHRASRAYRKDLAYVYVRRGLFVLNKEECL